MSCCLLVIQHSASCFFYRLAVLAVSFCENRLVSSWAFQVLVETCSGNMQVSRWAQEGELPAERERNAPAFRSEHQVASADEPQFELRRPVPLCSTLWVFHSYYRVFWKTAHIFTLLKLIISVQQPKSCSCSSWTRSRRFDGRSRKQMTNGLKIKNVINPAAAAFTDGTDA